MNHIRRRTSIVSVAVIITLSCLISLFYSIRIGYAPDEGNHVYMARHVANHFRLATTEEWAYTTYRGHPYHLYSPVPYVLHVPTVLLDQHFGFGHGFWGNDRTVRRLGGLVYAALQVIVTWLLGVALFGRTWTAVTFTSAVTMVPQLRYMHSYVNADSYTILIASVILMLSVRVIRDCRIDLGRSVMFGLAFAAMAHGKYNGWPVALIAMMTFCLVIIRQWPGLLAAYRQIGIALALPLLLAGPFYLHVFNLLDNGHILAEEEHVQLIHSTFRGVIPPPSPGLSVLLTRLPVELVFSWRSYWGWFVGYGELSPELLRSIFIAFVVSICGFIWFGRNAIKGSSDDKVVFWSCMLGLGVLFIILIADLVEWRIAGQGRIYMASLPLIIAMMMIGVGRILEGGAYYLPALNMKMRGHFWGARLFGGIFAAVLFMANVVMLVK